MTGEIVKASGFSLNKFIIAVLIFIAIGFIIETFTSYTQRTATQTTLEQRATIGDETQRLVKENQVLLNELTEKITNLENKLNNNEKTGKPVK